MRTGTLPVKQMTLLNLEGKAHGVVLAEVRVAGKMGHWEVWVKVACRCGEGIAAS